MGSRRIRWDWVGLDGIRWNRVGSDGIGWDQVGSDGISWDRVGSDAPSKGSQCSCFGLQLGVITVFISATRSAPVVSINPCILVWRAESHQASVHTLS